MLTLSSERPVQSLPAPVLLDPIDSTVFPSKSVPPPQLDPTDLEACIALALANLVQAARAQGQSLADIQADVLTDHQMLEATMRARLSDIVAEAWQRL